MPTVLFLHPAPGSGFDPEPSVTADAGYPIDSKLAEMARRPDEPCPECDRPWRDHATAT